MYLSTKFKETIIIFLKYMLALLALFYGNFIVTHKFPNMTR